MAGSIAHTIFDDLGAVVSKSAPLLGSVLGSPLAGIGVSLISNLFGSPSGDLTKLIETIKNDPDATIKLRTLEAQHQETLLQIASKDYETEIKDRDSARQREVSLHSYVPTILALGFLLNYAAIQFYCVIHNNTVNDIISARFQDVLIMIMSYYFGSRHPLVRQ